MSFSSLIITFTIFDILENKLDIVCVFQTQYVKDKLTVTLELPIDNLIT